MRALLLLGVLAVVAGCGDGGGGGISSAVSVLRGEPTTCSKIGVVNLAGTTADVYQCQHSDSPDGTGCYSRLDDSLYNVSRQFSLATEHHCFGLAAVPIDSFR